MMKKRNGASFFIGVALLAGFVVWTLLVCFIDVAAIGPRESSIGFAKLNGYVHNLTGVNMTLYKITDWLGLVPFGVALGFALFGFIQLIKRKSFFKVDRTILYLGGFYIIVIAVYIFFEKIIINYRPVLIDGYLEVSYPSSTTMLTASVMPSAAIELNSRIKNIILRRIVIATAAAFTAFMVIGRLISGVHWFTDIIGGILFSSGAVLIYRFVCT